MIETPQNIILAGFMGTGKTTVGRLLAQKLGWTFADTDRMIEEQAGKSVAQIFKEDGETVFRDMETAIAISMSDRRQHVFSTGGGFVLRPENLQAARRAGRVILLVASPEEIWHRVRQSRHRPLLLAEDPMLRIRQLLYERAEAYGAIKERVVTDGRTPEFIVEEIMTLLNAQ